MILQVNWLVMTDNLHDKVTQDDQSILNMPFENRWLKCLPYNCITHTTFSDYEPEKGLYPPVTTIIANNEATRTRVSWKEYTHP